MRKTQAPHRKIRGLFAGEKMGQRKSNGEEYIEEMPHDMKELREIVTVLRSKNGCKWDRAQTLETLKKCLTDETEEVLEAIDHNDHVNLCEELGDLLLQVLLQSEIASENGWFSYDDVVQMLTEKLIRRHPHVFGDEVVNTPEESLALWNKVKEREKKMPKEIRKYPDREKKEGSADGCI